MRPVHPGRILKNELATRGLSASRLALNLHVPSGRITDIINGKRGISAETAVRLGLYFGNGGLFWMNLQSQYELGNVEQTMGEQIKSEMVR